jgi:hypothetical protein
MQLIIHGMRPNASLKNSSNPASRQRSIKVHAQNAQNQQNALIAA